MTLIKAYLMENDNPFIMLKCYLEEINKADMGQFVEEFADNASDYRIENLENELNAIIEKYPDITSKKMFGDNPYDWENRMVNLHTFRNYLSSLKIEDPIIQKILKSLDKVLEIERERMDSFYYLSEEERKKKKKGEKGEEIARNSFINSELKKLRKVYNLLENIKVKILSGLEIDLSGELIFDDIIEEDISKLIDVGYLANLRDIASGDMSLTTIRGGGQTERRILSLVQKIINILSEEVTYPNSKGVYVKDMLSEAIIDINSQKTKVVLAKIKDIETIQSRFGEIADKFNREGVHGLKQQIKYLLLDEEKDVDTDEVEEILDGIIEVDKNLLKANKILNALDSKERKRLKKTIQAAEPTEYFGQDYTKLGELIEMMEELDLVKDDSKLTKKIKSISEQNVDMVATASKLRKQYEQLYKQVRKIVYPKSASSLRDEK